MEKLKLLTLATILTLSVKVASAQSDLANILQSMGFEKMEIQDEIFDKVKRVDGDPTHSDVNLVEEDAYTLVNSIETDSTQEVYLHRVEGDKELIVRLFKQGEEEYGTGEITIDGQKVKLDQEGINGAVEAFNMNLPDLIGEDKVTRI